MTLRSLFIFTLLCSISVSCNREEKKNTTASPIEVTDFVVEPKNIPAMYDYIGFAKSSHPVEIRAKVEGYLEKIAYVEGQQVKEGALLFQLDPKQFEAKVEEAKGEVLRQEALLENAKLTVNRLKPLYEQKAASKKDLDNAIANQLAAAAALQSAKASLLEADINLGYTTITSPITGATDKARFREGALINPAENTLLTTVSVLDPIWVYFSVSDSDILKVKKQLAEQNVTVPKDAKLDVQVLMSDGSAYQFMGKVDYSSPTYDQSTGTLQVRAVFPNPHSDLLPGQFVRVKVFGIEHPKALYVPRRALLQKKDGMFVYLINPNGKAIAQDVSTGDWYGEYQIITQGLKIGDHIVVDGINKIVPGSTVKVIGEWKPDAIDATPSSKVD